MKSWLQRLRRSDPPRPTDGSEHRHEPQLVPTADLDAYPSVDRGISVRTVDEILRAHEDLLARIKLCYGADRPTFEAHLLDPIKSYASFVNLLPATPDNFFNDAGGLFRLGLEVAFFSLQGTDGHIVSGRSTISTRRELEPRWRHATFLAGLCSEIHRTLSQLIVTDERGDEWPAYLVPLTPWLAERGSKRFFVRWLANSQESRALGLFALPHIVARETMQHLATGNSIAVPQLLSCVSGLPLYREQNVLVDLVRRAAALVIDQNLTASSSRYGKPILGAHLERYLIDAMRRLIASQSSWSPNQERSRVWLAADGMFIVWPNAAADIRRLLEEDELPGIPKSPETILEILTAAGVFLQQSQTQPLWKITPPPGRTEIDAIKVATPGILLTAPSQLASALDQHIASAPGQVASPQVASQEPATPPTTSAQTADSQSPRTENDRSDLAREPHVASPLEPTDHAVRIPPSIASLGTQPPPGPVPCKQPAGEESSLFRLKAPFRLSPQVRDSLAVAVESLNLNPREALAITVPAGLFVPLAHFKGARLDVPVVIRALADVGMLAPPPGGDQLSTSQQVIRGNAETGIVIRPTFIAGLDPSDFLLT